jgi:hypothetical protein
MELLILTLAASVVALLAQLGDTVSSSAKATGA